jgi:hypothetical protein
VNPKQVMRFLPVLLVGIMLTACERNATRSVWSPMNAAPTPTSQPLSLTPDNPPTQAIVTPVATPEFIPTLDVNALPETFPISMKGYELLSWRHEGDWVFTLMTGTNRAKTFEEILTTENQYSSELLIKITVKGTEDLLEVLSRLPRKEQISWGGMILEGEVPATTLYFTFPPDSIVYEIEKFCIEHGITLITLKEN